MTPPIRHILVCGGGLAAHMTAAALSRSLDRVARVTLAEVVDTGDGDLFYGTVTGPSAYAFNLAAGLDEPSLALRSDAAFSWGTRYQDWGGRSWTQGFALPFPVIDGVLFHHYLAAAGIDVIEPFLIGAVAAARNAFAHPPRGSGEQHPLSRADYGYQCDPADYARLFAETTKVERITGVLDSVATGPEGIKGLRLSDGGVLTADLYVDCSGPAAHLLSAITPPVEDGRPITVSAWDAPAEAVHRPVRTVTATPQGWQSTTPLRDRTLHLAIHDPATPPPLPPIQGNARTATAALTRRAEAWVGNCVGIGHAAGVVEPISPSPILLLERDVERLLALIPNDDAMAMERREYNRRFDADRRHAALFDRALLMGKGFPDTPYWRAALDQPVPEPLARKLDLFTRRGVLVGYDLEPYHPEDWTILHLGMGRRPERHDRLADRAALSRLRPYLDEMQRGIAQAAAGLPDCATYRTRLEAYLRARS